MFRLYPTVSADHVGTVECANTEKHQGRSKKVRAPEGAIAYCAQCRLDRPVTVGWFYTTWEVVQLASDLFEFGIFEKVRDHCARLRKHRELDELYARVGAMSMATRHDNNQRREPELIAYDEDMEEL